MNLTKLTLSNFISFVQPTTVNFDDLSPGLYFVAGRNEVEPSLGSNGAGKSTLWEAWYWCLYGRTQDNRKAADVSNFVNGKTVLVEMEWTQQSQVYVLRRQWNPNSLTLKKGMGREQVVSQEDLQDVIRLTQAEFSASVFMGQGGSHFFDKTPAEKMALLQETLGLSLWLEWSKVAADMQSEIRGKIAEQERVLVSLQGRASTLAENITKYEQLDLEFADYKEKEVVRTDEELRAYVKKVAADQREYNKLVKLENAHLDAMEKIESENDKLQKEKTETDAALRTGEKLLYSADREVTSAKKAREQVESMGAVCLTCKQKITAQHLKGQRAEATAAIARAEKKRKDEKQKVDAFIKEVEKAKSVALKAERLYQEKDVVFAETRDRLNHLQNWIESVHPDRLKVLKKGATDAKAATSSSSSLLSDAKTGLKKNEAEQKTIQTTLNKLVADAEHQGYWVKGFKDIRLYLMDEAVSTLEIETNQALSELGMHDWSVRFDVEREKKTGGIAKGFSVEVSPPHGKSMLWEAWSGGESQRLRLAGRAGLSNMVLSARSLTPGVEVWDEPTQYLGEEGIEDIKEALRQRAASQGIKIFLVDHRAYDFSGFEDRWTVVKDRNGSRVERG